jgi:hypothetical protein
MTQAMILLPYGAPDVESQSTLEAAMPVGAATRPDSDPPDRVAVNISSVSDGDLVSSLPSKDGESEPAVMLACAPSGNDARPELAPSSEGRASSFEFPELPEFLRRNSKAASSDLSEGMVGV